MGFFDFLVKDVETKDLHDKPNLRTRYYKCEYNIAKETVIRYCRERNYTIENVDDKYGELFIQTPSFHMIVSIRRASVINVSIDIKVSVYSFIARKKPFKMVDDLYNYCNKKLPFIGVGLQPSL